MDIEEGIPDGMCFDSSGNLWVAMWGSGKISHFNKEGTLLKKIDLPVLKVSNVCFGGANMNHLFVSSANLNDESNRYAGSLFDINFKDVTGLSQKKAKFLKL